MKIIQIKVKQILSAMCLVAVCLPFGSDAQHFGHGGGGGGGSRGGGGGAVRGGGNFGGGARGGEVRSGNNGGARGGEVRGGNSSGTVRTFGGGSRPGTINGGSNTGFHFFGGGRHHDERPVITVHDNENAYHHVGGGFHPYVYHPYHPYYWGPRWHPFGYFLGGLTADAIMLSIAGQPYYYDEGVYYQPYNGGYQATAPPIGAEVSYLPAGFETIPMDDYTYYYYAGVFYVSEGGSYRVVPAPVGAIVTQIPEGATEQYINGQSYLLYNNTYYIPISSDGQDAYQVVQVN